MREEASLDKTSPRSSAIICQIGATRLYSGQSPSSTIDDCFGPAGSERRETVSARPGRQAPAEMS